jgi:hypothetical protein
MISSSQILYGAAPTAVGEAMLTVAVPSWRHTALVATAVVVAVLAVLGRQAVLHVTHAQEFFTDLPFRPFPVSGPDIGSGGRTLAVTALVFAYGALRRHPAPAAATLAAATGAVAVLVDVYLY